MKVNLTKATLYLVCLTLVLGLLASCASEPTTPAGDPEADVKIEALFLAEATIFSVTVKSVSGITGASSFNLLGDETRDSVNLGEIADNFVSGTTEIALEIYNEAGATIASATLDAADYEEPFEGAISLTAGASAQSTFLKGLIPSFTTTNADVLQPQQTGNLDILATGILPDLRNAQNFNTTRSIEVPLNCGPSAPGAVNPPAGEGFFIINDVMIEYRYGMANPIPFNSILTTELQDSGLEFENMGLYFRLPGSTVIQRVRPLPLGALSASEAATVLGGVSQGVSASNPFGTGIAFVDITLTPFGQPVLVEEVVTRVTGSCTNGAQSHTVSERLEQLEPFEAIGDQVDKNTLDTELILYILGNEVEVRDQELDACGNWTPSSSGGSEGTLDRWDISDIPAGASFSFRFDAFDEPDKFTVEYPEGSEQIATGWRGSRTPPDGGTLAGPGTGQEDNLFTKTTSNTITVLVEGGRSGTAWNYSLRCDVGGSTPPSGGLSGIWSTDSGDMQFNGDGTGSYASSDGPATIEYTLDNTGTIMRGYWIENLSSVRCSTQRGGKDYWGRFEFRFFDNFTRFEGLWNYCDDAPSRGGWDGTKK